MLSLTAGLVPTITPEQGLPVRPVERIPFITRSPPSGILIGHNQWVWLSFSLVKLIPFGMDYAAGISLGLLSQRDGDGGREGQ
jgi:hypothetical protein